MAPRCDRPSIFFRPSGDDQAPFAMFIHGGWWRSLEPSMFSQMAAGPNAHGVSVAIVGYDLCPHVSIADYHRTDAARLPDVVAQARQRIFVYGHSAGGHLAACMAGDRLEGLASDAPADLGAGGLRDFRRVRSDAADCMYPPNAGPAARRRAKRDAFRRSTGEYRPGASLDAVVGALESSEFLRQSKAIAEAWRARGVDHALRGNRRHQPFYRGRCARRSQSAMTRALQPSPTARTA